MLPPASIASLRAAASALAVTVLLGGCVHTVNFEDPARPRYAGLPAVSVEPTRDGTTLVVGTFNVKYGVEVDRALEVIQDHPQLGSSDVVLLQEMDAEGTRRMAEALGMHWVYYPAALREGREFGNAVLSRWPITGDEKLILPHRSFIGDTQRIATVATLDVEGRDVRVYSVHIATPVNQTYPQRVDQMRTVLEDAAGHDHVIIGGDLNSVELAELGTEFGFAWPTREGPRTAWFGRIDHILYRGFQTPGQEAVGTVLDNGGASDHKPVWTRAVFSGS